MQAKTSQTGRDAHAAHVLDKELQAKKDQELQVKKKTKNCRLKLTL